MENAGASFGRMKLKNAVNLREFMETRSMEFELDGDSEDISFQRDAYWLEDDTVDCSDPEDRNDNDKNTIKELNGSKGRTWAEAVERRRTPTNQPAVVTKSLQYFTNIAQMKAEDQERREQEALAKQNAKPKRRRRDGFDPVVAEGKVPITEDGQLLKIIRHSGNGDKPPIGSRVWIKYIVFREDDRERTTETAIDFGHQNHPYTFVLFEHQVVAALEYGVASMEVHEHAEFLASAQYSYGPLGMPGIVGPHTNCVFVVELLKFMDVSSTDFTKLDPEEQQEFSFVRVKEAALHHKESGNMGHQEKKWEYALQQYRKGVVILDRHLTIDKDEDEDRNELLFILYNNIVQTYLEMDNGRKALSYCTKALDLPPDTKGNRAKLTFRQSQAYLLLNKLEEARDACAKVLKMEPGNNCATGLYDKIMHQIGEEKATSNAVFDKIAKVYFSSSSSASK